MPQDYQGYVIPTYTDVADAPQAFQDYTDSVIENTPPALDINVARPMTVSTNPPSGTPAANAVWYVVSP